MTYLGVTAQDGRFELALELLRFDSTGKRFSSSATIAWANRRTSSRTLNASAVDTETNSPLSVRARMMYHVAADDNLLHQVSNIRKGYSQPGLHHWSNLVKAMPEHVLKIDFYLLVQFFEPLEQLIECQLPILEVLVF